MRKSNIIWPRKVAVHLDLSFTNTLTFKNKINCIDIILMISDNTTMDKLGARDVAVASSVSKIFASTLTYPHEVMTSLLSNFEVLCCLSASTR